MSEKFFPDMYFDSVFEIPYKELLAQGKTALIFDVDNTLAPYFVPRPPAKVVALFSRLRNMGFELCLLTNNRGKRLKLFNERMGLPAVHLALKPLTIGVRRAVRLLGAKRENIALIGDQIFSDVWCGKRAGITTILIKPISRREEITVRIKRRFEKKIMREYLEKLNKGKMK